jgi:hypothetical protein
VHVPFCRRAIANAMHLRLRVARLHWRCHDVGVANVQCYQRIALLWQVRSVTIFRVGTKYRADAAWLGRLSEQA